MLPYMSLSSCQIVMPLCNAKLMLVRKAVEEGGGGGSALLVFLGNCKISWLIPSIIEPILLFDICIHV